MGYTSPLVVRYGVMVCDCTSSSFLVDGVSVHPIVSFEIFDLGDQIFWGSKYSMTSLPILTPVTMAGQLS